MRLEKAVSRTLPEPLNSHAEKAKRPSRLKVAATSLTTIVNRISTAKTQIVRLSQPEHHVRIVRAAIVRMAAVAGTGAGAVEDIVVEADAVRAAAEIVAPVVVAAVEIAATAKLAISLAISLLSRGYCTS
jgi:hypothetical protein